VTHRSPVALRTARLLGIVVSPLVLGLTLVVIGTATPGYRPWADAFSRLGSYDEPHAVLARAGIVVYGLLVGIGAGPLGGRVPRRTARLLAFVVAGYGVAAVVAGIAPKDPPGTPHTATSQIHVAAMLLVAVDAVDPAERRVAVAVFVVTACAAVAFPFTWGTEIYGVVELLMLATASLWLAELALRSVSETAGSGALVPRPSARRRSR
jgi:hypothetical membrane protein